ESSMQICLLAEKVKFMMEEDTPLLTIPGIHHQLLMNVVKSIIQNEASSFFHFTPFKYPEERVYFEAYCSDVMLEMYQEVQALPRDKENTMEHAVASLILYSDFTHLTNFGMVVCWPVYLFLGNQSKYEHARPTLNLYHYVAYIPTLPDTIQNEYMKQFGKSVTVTVLTHCKHELMHVVMVLVLDAKFPKVYNYGIIVSCSDSISWQFYSKIFAYLANYLEKYI
ncbi:hypothetical protein OBBRIDRAFT_740074, partial [Obba rivulosa]